METVLVSHCTSRIFMPDCVRNLVAPQRIEKHEILYE